MKKHIFNKHTPEKNTLATRNTRYIINHCVVNIGASVPGAFHLFITICEVCRAIFRILLSMCTLYLPRKLHQTSKLLPRNFISSSRSFHLSLTQKLNLAEAEMLLKGFRNIFRTFAQLLTPMNFHNMPITSELNETRHFLHIRFYFGHYFVKMNFVYFYRQLTEGHHIHKEFIYNNVFRNVSSSMPSKFSLFDRYIENEHRKGYAD